ncbi:Photosystem II 12 kDa extrinsic protein (PsbU) [Richelia intracellularis HH01]|uniref:Photosystem II extrinsic protein U n=1 Tax=Richelia intracellularis HH01 TaxID=1165094 RepID=M1X4N0_9NOST|nr:photosystem II complex extrinsic protein PsbU [Richelia intracellularis]CCH66431.1 Photosystem II 12 kDa extrinsic protein (PsbU) [Richelia intracellularis HH01]HAE05650.1 Photosystem II extrinsic protein [Richelia sp.]
MKYLTRLLIVFSLQVVCFGWFFTSQLAHAANSQSLTLPTVSILGVEVGRLRNRADETLADVYGDKIDLNNTNVRAFQNYRGLYPTLASKVIKNAPYKKVEDVLKIKGLGEHQIQLLQDNLNNFTVNEPESLFNEGDDRINPGIYR